MRLQSKGVLEFGINSEYKIDYYAEDDFLIINNGYEISERISTDLINGFIKDSDSRIEQLNQTTNKLINELSQDVKINDSVLVSKNKFLNLSSEISTKPLLDKLNYYFNFDEIEIDKRIKLQWPDIKSLLMSIIFTSIFFISSINRGENSVDYPQGSGLYHNIELVKYLWHSNPGFLLLRVTFLIMSISTFLISFYSTNKKFIKAYFKNGTVGIKKLKKDLIKKQIDSLLTRQMSDYGSATNDSINNFLDLLNLKYKKIKEQIIEEVEADYSLVLNYNITSRSLAENDLVEINQLIQTIQSKLN